nr:uncharacterized protein LOC113722694 [Coffea arabica]
MDRSMLDAASGGALVNKTTDEATLLISTMAENSQQFGVRADGAIRRVNEVNHSDLEGKLSELTSLVRQMARGQLQSVKTCGICAAPGHMTDMCPTLQEDSPEQANIVGDFSGPPPRRNDPFAPITIQGGEIILTLAMLQNPLAFNNISTTATSLQSKKEESEKEILDTFRKVEINIPLLDAIRQLPKYAKFLKGLCTNRNKLSLDDKVKVGENVSAMFQRKLPQKCKDPGPLKETRVIIQLADRSNVYPEGLVEDVLVKVNEFIFPVDFYIVDMNDEYSTDSAVILLGRPFMSTARTKIDVHEGTLSVEFDGEKVTFNIFDAMKHPVDTESVNFVGMTNTIVQENFEQNFMGTSWTLSYNKARPIWKWTTWRRRKSKKLSCPYIHYIRFQAPNVELKELPEHLKYAYLGDNKTLPVIIANDLTALQEERLLRVLREFKPAIGWTQWVSPVHVVPKKTGITLVKNEKNELVPMRLQNGWRMCIDFRKLNAATRKDHFPLPFIDEMLERLAVYGDSFDQCLDHLTKVLKRCIETNLVLNYEKCHFMVKEGIVLGHVVSSRGIEVDKAKIDLITSLPYPTNVKDIRSFLGHAGFYRRFIKDFSKIAQPLSRLLQKEVPFNFGDDCKLSFDTLKGMLTTAPIIQPPDWKLSFELMCDASQYAVGAVLGQRSGKCSHVIYYASKTLTPAQCNYTTTEKELLAIVFAFEKFRSYLLGSKVTVYSDHAALKYPVKKGVQAKTHSLGALAARI